MPTERERYIASLRGLPQGGGMVGQPSRFQPSGGQPSVQQNSAPSMPNSMLMDVGKNLGARFAGPGAAPQLGVTPATASADLSAPLANSTNTLGASNWMSGVGGGGGGGATGGGFGQMAASAGPWAALAAAIIGNEEHSRKKGLRAEDRGERLKDQLTGKVLTQDIEGKWAPYADKLTGGAASKSGITGDWKAGSQIASGRIGSGLKTLTKEGTTGKIADFLRKLF